MKLATPLCPTCSEPAEGTVDDIPGIAKFGEVTEGGFTEYGGSTRVCWEGQKPRMNDKDETLVQCYEGHDWYTKIDYEATDELKTYNMLFVREQRVRRSIKASSREAAKTAFELLVTELDLDSEDDESDDTGELTVESVDGEETE